MELIDGIGKEEYFGYSIYRVNYLSDDIKGVIRNRLVSICHGEVNNDPSIDIFSYKETIKAFLERYSENDDNRKKGMIGELLVHVIFEIEGEFVKASPFFNLEEKSFKKGYDITLISKLSNELWITEIKSGEKQKKQKTASEAMIRLLGKAKNDLKTRLSENDGSLWRNAIHAARASMEESSTQKQMAIKILGRYSNDATQGRASSGNHNVILAGMLFHSMSEKMEEEKIRNAYINIVDEDIFCNVCIVAIQKEAFYTVYSFLESEVCDEV